MNQHRIKTSKKASEETSPPTIRGRLRGGKKTKNKCYVFSILVFQKMKFIQKIT